MHKKNKHTVCCGWKSWLELCCV